PLLRSHLFPYTTLFRSFPTSTIVISACFSRCRISGPLIRFSPSCRFIVWRNTPAVRRSLPILLAIVTVKLIVLPTCTTPAELCRSEEHTSELQSRENLV